MMGAFGLGLGGDDGARHSAEDPSEWETAFKVEALTMEVHSLMQERRLVREQIERAHDGLRALGNAMELLAYEVQVARHRDGNGGRGGRPDVSLGFSGEFGRASSERSLRLQAELDQARRAVAGAAGLRAEFDALAPSQWEQGGENGFGSHRYAGLDAEETLSSDELMAKADQPETHELERSIWDACLFLGLGVFGRFDSALLFVTWLVNVVVQFLFTVIIWSRFHQSPYAADLVDSLRKWRALYGHDSMYMNPATQESMVNSVCQGSDIITNSQGQVHLYKTMREFLPGYMPEPLTDFIRENLDMPDYSDKGMPRDGGVPFDQYWFNGVHLCTMLMLLWTLMIFRELRSAYETHSSIWAKARQHPRDSIIVRIPSSGHLILRTITTRRAWGMTVFVFIPRSIIACLLLVGGSYFIIAADNMEDLILNALSLEFIIHTDELLYSVIAPKSIRMLVEEVRPLTTGVFFNRFRKQWKIIMVFLILGYVAAINLLVLDPVVTSMKDAMTTMCGGDIDFVVTRYSDGITRAVDPDPTSTDNLQTNYAYCSVLQRTGLAGAKTNSLMSPGKLIKESDKFKCASITNPKFVFEAFGTGELKRKGSLALQEMQAYANSPCVDSDVVNDVRIRLLLQEATGNHFLTRCSDAWAVCGEPPDTGFASTLVRLYCPQTCKCDSPAQFFAGAGEGCPRLCGVKWTKTLRVATHCQDFGMDELSRDTEWIGYVQSAVKYLEQMGTAFALNASRYFNRTGFVGGCAAMAERHLDPQSFKRIDFCQPEEMLGGAAGSEHRTIRYFCPETCGCAQACITETSCQDCPRNCGGIPVR